MKHIFIIILFCFGLVMAQPQYVVTIQPLKDILDEVVAGRATVECLMPPGASPHTFEPKPSDLGTVKKALLFFTGDEHLDNWASEFQHPAEVEMFHLVPHDYHLEIIALIGKNRGTTFGEDPHFWTDPLTVKAMLPNLVEKLSASDPEGRAVYQSNAAAFSGRLDSLYQAVDAQLKPFRGEKVILTHPFFQYFLKRFGLKLAAIIEPLPGTEPSPRDVMEVVNLVRDEKIKLILAHPIHSKRPAELVAESTDCSIIELDPLGGTEGRKGYANLIRFNADQIQRALTK